MAPDFVVDREERPHYEKDRFLSMETNLKRGDVLFDVGSELGWQSSIFAKFVGPENMCLFEPHAELWPTIWNIWAMNGYNHVKLACQAFVSDRSTDAFYSMNSFPPASSWPAITNFDDWEKIHVNPSAETVAVDRLVARSFVIPQALTIDVEGAELKVLKGAEFVLTRFRPLVWVSVHPTQRLAAFGATKQEIFDLMKSLGYWWQYLGVDHEEHWFFYPKERRNDVVLVDSPWMTNGKRNLTFEEAIPNWTDDMGMPYTAGWVR
jgi:FkbM family methyltransferase